MRKKLFFLLVICCIPLFAIAQQSIGFSDPDNIQPLLDYRLPEWGYTNFYLDFSADGQFQKNKSDNSSAINNLFSGRLAPNYTRYFESEPRISTYRISPVIDYSFRNQTSATDDEDTSDDLELSLQWSLNEKLYLDDSNYFFTGSLYGLFRQLNEWEKEFIQSVVDSEEDTLYRLFNPTLSVGIGYGRLRTVNPIIQSLRLKERLNSLNTDENLNRQDIINAADQFTKLNGYQQAYDRPQKYFWGDMDEQLTADLSGLNPFDLLYLTDVTSEALGTRLEGWEVSASIDLQYNVQYFHQENGNSGGSSSETSTTTSVIPTLNGVWYKNLTLRHQIGLSGSFRYQKLLGEDSPFDDSTIFNSSASWLYSITDRFLMNNVLTFLRVGRDGNPINRLLFRSSFDYFIENRFSLFANVDYHYAWDSTQTFVDGSLIESFDERDIRFTAGLRYYLKRGLF